MENIEKLIDSLTDKNDKNAYESLKLLLAVSEKTNAVYLYFDTFIEMMDNDHSYYRTRAMLLIAANARWDTDNKIDEIIDVFLKHVMDDKPITARQIIRALPDIAKYKPDLIKDICAALDKANPEKYPITMQSLIQKDIAAALKEIRKLNLNE